MKVKLILCGLLVTICLGAAERQLPANQKWDAKKFYKATKPSLPLAKQLIDGYPIAEYESILDVGCGPGTLTAYMAKKADKKTHVAGFDPSSEMIAFAQGYYQKPANLYFRQGALPKIKNNWDFIFCSNAIQYFTKEQQIEALKAFAECAWDDKRVPLLLITAAKTNSPQVFDKAYAATLGLERWKKLREVKLDEYYAPHDEQSFTELAKQTPWKITKTAIQDEHIIFKNIKSLKRFIGSWMGGFAFIAQLPKAEQKVLLNDLVAAYVKEVPPAANESIEWRSPRLIVHAEKVASLKKDNN